ncbi:MAG: molybdenum cofactor guanylyltransferase [Deltaproteobacteria bacterium]|nr:molybdenum cofactor guanylyltransferase [Deltaproteobacteria bacterium]MBW1873701.1 molybdenum cofactor guanylyltransferase [Deltaproteobacteria bacterium]
METVPVYILAGGKSSRIGSDKARFMFKGKPLLTYAAQSIQPVAASITVVADIADKYLDLGYQTIADLQPGLGPLGGIYTALCHHATDDYFLCISCDRIGIQPEWLDQLIRAREKNAKAIVFRGEKWHPFPALYHASLKAQVQAALAENQLAPWKIFERIDVCALNLPSNWDVAVDINNRQALDYLTSQG